jgi:multicomponent K+:H+ antiporter subunit C
VELVFALVIGTLTSTGIYLLLRARTFPVVVGLTLLSYGVNLFLFSTGRLMSDGQPIIGGAEPYSDPLPQALALTAIVIGFAMTAFLVALALRSHADTDVDHVDGVRQQETTDEQVDRTENNQ